MFKDIPVEDTTCQLGHRRQKGMDRTYVQAAEWINMAELRTWQIQVYPVYKSSYFTAT